jgi:hypothetical protein
VLTCVEPPRLSLPRLSLPRLVSYSLLEEDNNRLKLDMTRADNPSDPSTYRGTRAYLYEGDGLGAMYGQWQIEVRACMCTHLHMHAHSHSPSHAHAHVGVTDGRARPCDRPSVLTRTRSLSVGRRAHLCGPQVLLGNNFGDGDSFCEAFVLSGRDEYGYYVDGLGSTWREGPNIGGRHNLPEIDVVETYWSCKGGHQYQNNCTQTPHTPSGDTGESLTPTGNIALGSWGGEHRRRRRVPSSSLCLSVHPHRTRRLFCSQGSTWAAGPRATVAAGTRAKMRTSASDGATRSASGSG